MTKTICYIYHKFYTLNRVALFLSRSHISIPPSSKIIKIGTQCIHVFAVTNTESEGECKEGQWKTLTTHRSYGHYKIEANTYKDISIDYA